MTVADFLCDARGWFTEGACRCGVELTQDRLAVKAIYALADDTPPAVRSLVAISPPRLSHSHFLQSSQAEMFQHRVGEPPEFDPIPVYRNIMKWAVRVNFVERIPELTARAFAQLKNGKSAIFASAS